MDNRYTPFGYHVEDGAISIAETEAAIIRQIFSDYIGGKSLKEIAAELTVRKVEYLPQKWQWNKNRVVRVINDIRYLGNDVYAAIVDESTFRKAQDMKLARNTQKEYDRNTVISQSVTNLVCGKCGSHAMRVHDNRSKFGQKYVCTNKECGTEYRISADMMITMIADLIPKDILESSETDKPDIMMEIHQMEQEIARAIEYADRDTEQIRRMILECANKKYQAASSGRANLDKVKQNISREDFTVNRKIVMELVSQIKLISDEEIEITLINGQVLRKENPDGDNSTIE